MLKVEELTGGYGSSKVLFGMAFEASEGEVISLIGRNGMGKTTTVKTLMGMLPATGGSVTFRGRVLGRSAPSAVARLGVGLVPEGRRVFGSLSVRENLVATARPASGGWSLERVYELFPRLKERSGQSSRTLSGGEQQMLVVGRALMTNPKLLILDEATEGLAPLIRQEIWRCLRALKAEGQTILVIDKNLPEMATLVDRHYIVDKGRVAGPANPPSCRRSRNWRSATWASERRRTHVEPACIQGRRGPGRAGIPGHRRHRRQGLRVDIRGRRQRRQAGRVPGGLHLGLSVLELGDEPGRGQPLVREAAAAPSNCPARKSAASPRPRASITSTW